MKAPDAKTLPDDALLLWLDATMAELDRRESPGFSEIEEQVSALDDEKLSALTSALFSENEKRTDEMAQSFRKLMRAPSASRPAATG